jgi:hypothetical protein
MKKLIITFVAIIALFAGSSSFAKSMNVGGVEQIPPKSKNEQPIGAGWGHRSMTFGMMNFMSGMITQVATIIDSEKASPEMNKRLAEILDHIAEMLNYAPAYMMGTKVVDSDMIHLMQGMLQDLEKMRKEIGIH